VAQINIRKQRIQVDSLDKQRLEQAFPDPQRIQTYAPRIITDHWRLPVEIPSTKETIPVVVSPRNDRDPVRDNVAFKASNPLSSDDSFDPLNVFPMKVPVVFRPVLE
jgi:ribosomal protein S10